MACRKTKDELIGSAMRTHGDVYDYTLSEAVPVKKKTIFICAKHGSFEQSWQSHINGRGCPKCGLLKLSDKKTIPFAELVKRANTTHNNKYTYVGHVDGAGNKASIICKKHGVFTQRWTTHILGGGCQKCAKVKRSDTKRRSLAELIEVANKTHGCVYSYEEAEVVGAHSKVRIVCEEHGVFEQVWYAHHAGSGCPKCANIGPSKQETELADWVESLGFKVDRNRRDLLGNGKEVDIFVPALNLCIEYNGIYHHMRHPERYHQDKTKSAMKNGYRMIHIFDDQWIGKPEHVKGILRLALGKPVNILHARNLVVDPEVSSEEARSFLSDNHIYEFSGAKIKLGLRAGDGELVSLMTFGDDRFGGKHKHGYELIRFANLQGCSIVGGAKKLHDFFLKEWKPWSISCYADASLFEGAAYANLGYENHGITQPNNWYMYKGKRAHRMGFTKVKLEDRFDVDCDNYLTAHENVIKHLKLQFLWDCGSWKLTWNRA